MSERRSGVDLIECEGGWVVEYDGWSLSLHEAWNEAVVAARVQSIRIRAGAAKTVPAGLLRRLLHDRRREKRPDPPDSEVP